MEIHYVVNINNYLDTFESSYLNDQNIGTPYHNSKITVFDLITAHAPISAQSSN